MMIEDFLRGTWNCDVVGGEGANSDLQVRFDVADDAVTVTQNGGDPFTYLYKVTPNGLETDDGFGGGWTIEAPLEIIPNEDFRAFVTSANGSGTDESPRIEFKDGAVVVDSFYRYVLSCKQEE